MRKGIWASMCLAGLVILGSVAYAGHQTYQGFQVVHVLVNGKQVTSDVPAINFHGRTMLPVRAVAEALGASVTWDGATSTATLSTPRTYDPSAPMYTYEGTGQGVSKLMDLNAGLYIVKANHKNGTANFAVTLLDNQGTWVDLVANDIGAYSGTKAVSIRRSGKYIFDVLADGEWSLEVRKAE